MRSPTVAVPTRHQFCYIKEDDGISMATSSGMSQFLSVFLVKFLASCVDRRRPIQRLLSANTCRDM